MPTLAETNRVGIRIVEESTWGTTPTGPNMADLPYTSESFRSNITTVTSDTIRSDRNIPDVVKVGGGAGGNLGFELRYTDYDLLLGMALQSSAVTTNVSAAIASGYFSGNTMTVDSNGFSNVVSGQHLRVTGASNTSNNGTYRIKGFTSTAGGHHRVSCVIASSNAAAGFTSDVFAAATKVQGTRIRNGTTARSATIEKAMNDVGEFFRYAGMRLNTMSLNFESQSILTGDAEFLGKSQATASVTVASAVTNSSGNDVMNASGHVANVWVNGDAVSTAYFRSLGVSMTNNLREQQAIGYDENIGIGSGRFEATGTLTAYFEDRTFIDAFVNGTDGSIRAEVKDPDGNSIMVTVPKVRWTDATAFAPGINDDVMADLSWGAFIDDTGTYTVQFDLLDA